MKTGLTRDGTPAHQRDDNPHQIRVPVQTRALQEIRTLTPIPLQHAPKPHRHQPRIPIHQPRGTTQQLEVIRKVVLALVREVLIDCPRQKQYDNHSSSDPHRAVEIWVSFQDIEEVGAGIDGGGAAPQDFGRVDVEGLCVEGECPEETFARAAARLRSCWPGKERG